MLIQSLSDLPNLSHEKIIIADIESTNFDDTKNGLDPFHGGRIAGIGIGTEKGDRTWYLPVRHHCHEMVPYENLPLDAVVRYMNDVFSQVEVYSNHNAKFDGRFFWADGIKIRCKIQDTMVLGRIVEEQRDQRFGGTGYSLKALAKDYLPPTERKGSVSPYLKSIKSNDFGRLPIALCGKYCEQDVRVTALLRLALLKNLPAMSQEIWEVEQRCSKMLLRTEVNGICINQERLRQDYLSAMEALIKLLQEISSIAGWEVNVGSNKDMTKLLMHQLGIKPTLWNAAKPAKYKPDGSIKLKAKPAEPSWTAIVLDTLTMPENVPPTFGNRLASASRLQHFISLYCEGWKKGIGEDGRLHPTFKQWGTITGRLSTEDPNVQNPDDVSEGWVEPMDEFGMPDKTRALVYRDYSQIEYRVFGSYTQAPLIIDKYAADIDTDFHMFLADMLGTPRQFAKTLNFSFIYGMGKKALLKSLSAVLSLAFAKGDDRINTKMHALLTSGSTLEAHAHLLSTDETELVALKLYEKYHKLLPEIHKFQRLVASCCCSRGWVKNFFGRMYRLKPKHAYRGVNYIVQGSAGDFVKERACAVDEQLGDKYDLRLYTIVHDSVLHDVPREAAWDFYNESLPILEASRFRIPMRVDSKVSGASWGQLVKLGTRTPTREAFYAKLALSETNPPMNWATREQRKYEGTSTKGHGGI